MAAEICGRRGHSVQPVVMGNGLLERSRGDDDGQPGEFVQLCAGQVDERGQPGCKYYTGERSGPVGNAAGSEDGGGSALNSAESGKKEGLQSTIVDIIIISFCAPIVLRAPTVGVCGCNHIVTLVQIETDRPTASLSGKSDRTSDLGLCSEEAR